MSVTAYRSIGIVVVIFTLSSTVGIISKVAGLKFRSRLTFRSLVYSGKSAFSPLIILSVVVGGIAKGIIADALCSELG